MENLMTKTGFAGLALMLFVSTTYLPQLLAAAIQTLTVLVRGHSICYPYWECKYDSFEYFEWFAYNNALFVFLSCYDPLRLYSISVFLPRALKIAIFSPDHLEKIHPKVAMYGVLSCTDD